MSKQLKQVISLSKKTGDRVIVFDNTYPEDSFVLMGLDQYENLINSGKEEVLTREKKIDTIEKDNKSEANRNNNWKIPPQVKEEAEDGEE